MGTFTLWNPVFDFDEGMCAFHVRPDEFAELQDGDAGLIEDFLKVLDVRSIARSWKIEAFCSPYYAPARSTDWRDRFAGGWRVRVRLAQPVREAASYFPPPRVSEAIDPSWTDDFDADPWSERRCQRCVVIADLAAERAARVISVLRDEFPALEKIEAGEFPPQLLQIRADLGIIDVPQSISLVDELLDRCASMAATTHWAATANSMICRQQQNEFRALSHEFGAKYGYGGGRP